MPVSFGELKALSWLDLSHNTFDEALLPDKVVGVVIRPEDGRRCARAVVNFLQGVAAELAKKAEAQRAIEAAAEASRQAALREEKEAKKYTLH